MAQDRPRTTLSEHLSGWYRVAVGAVVELDANVYRADLSDGRSWVARCLPPAAQQAAETTALLLRRLESSPFPAERLAHPDPVSEMGGSPVLVTEFVHGPRAPGTLRMFAALGAMLGGLHSRSGEALPPGGAWHHLVPGQGTPRDEIRAAIRLLDETEGDPAARLTLRSELASLDDAEDLPQGVVHPDFVPFNVIRSPEYGPVVIDWLGAGRGPRLWSLGFLLWAAGSRNLEFVVAVAARYRERVSPTDDELDRLPDAVRGRALTIDAWSAAHGRLTWSEAVRRLDRAEATAERIAARARAAFRE